MALLKSKTKTKAKPASKPKATKVAKKDNKKVVKKPVAAAKKPAPAKTQKVVTKAPVKKLEAKIEKEVKKGPVAAVKNNAKANEKPLEKQVVKAVKPEAKADGKSKADAKSKSKSKKPEKKAEEDFDDVIIGDDFGESEIAEYEEDLKAVEDDDDDTNLDLSDDDDLEEKDEEIYLTDSEGRRLCRVRDCDQVSNVEGYCRYHYLLLWKKIQIRKHILIDGKLEKYVEDLMARYPDKFLDVIKKDLKTEKDFLSVIQEMELDENALSENDGEDEVQSFADEIRGIGEAPSMEDDSDF
ncbi:MAG: hypothetical protein H7061_03590 [Bdellovibrionaceae bacterium]|nr:hypothetical protein [Bdellovibrio sp.]